MVDWIAKALRRRPSAEERIAAAMRAAAPHSAHIRRALVHAAEVLIGRGACGRPLYAAAMRALADAGDEHAGALLKQALRCESSGGLSTLAAAAHFPAAAPGDLLARAAAARRPEIAFGAEMVRALRREARRAVLMDAAARLKESARIELCTQLLAPLLLLQNGLVALPPSVPPAMAVLRGSERHLGRWLVFACAGLAGGDRAPLEEAEERSRQGSSSARTAWALLAWALTGSKEAPEVKPSAEIVARLSDRPTAERDMSFLFRLAEVRSEGAQGMLASLSNKSPPDAVGVRATATLARVYGAADVCDRLRKVADRGGRALLQGIAVAGLWDAGLEDEAVERAEALSDARHLQSAVWGGLVLRARRGRERKAAQGLHPLIDERRFRYLERGWLE